MKWMQGQAGGDGWRGLVLTLLLLETAGLQLLYSSAQSGALKKTTSCFTEMPHKCNKSVSLHLPAFILVSLSLHFSQDIIQGSDLRGNGVNLDPNSIRVHPGHPGAGQTLRTGAKLAGVVVGPDGAREEPRGRVGGAPWPGAAVCDSFRAGARRVHTGGALADGDGGITSGVCLG